MLAFTLVGLSSPGFQIGLICGVSPSNLSPFYSPTLQPINSLAPPVPINLLESSTPAQALWNDILVKSRAVSTMESHACEKYRGVGVWCSTKNSNAALHVGKLKIDV